MLKLTIKSYDCFGNCSFPYEEKVFLFMNLWDLQAPLQILFALSLSLLHLYILVIWSVFPVFLIKHGWFVLSSLGHSLFQAIFHLSLLFIDTFQLFSPFIFILCFFSTCLCLFFINIIFVCFCADLSISWLIFVFLCGYIAGPSSNNILGLVPRGLFVPMYNCYWLYFKYY